MTQIKLPPFLTVTVENKASGPNWRDPDRQFIVLLFGNSEIARWEWQPELPVYERRELDDDDDIFEVTDFVAEKIRERLFPEEGK